jgi:predicted amidohydrolase YtcJ
VRAWRSSAKIATNAQTPLVALHELLITGGEIGEFSKMDIRIRRGRIAEIGVGLAHRDEQIIEADGGAVIPGLHDHHLHILSLAAALGSVFCGPPKISNRADLSGALTAAASRTASGAWIRGIGYHESVTGPLDRWLLDALVPDHPMRIQHRSGSLWILNSAAIRAIRLEQNPPPGVERDPQGRPTGRLYRADRWLGQRVPDYLTDLAAVGRLLSSLGVTGITDATPNLPARAVQTIQAAIRGGDIPQRVMALGVPAGSNFRAVGPFKIVIEEQAGIDLDALTARIVAYHADDRPVAIHCITRAETVAAVAALTAAGAIPGDRLEHASELPVELTPRVRELGVTIITQPNFIAERGDVYAAEVEPEEIDILYRCGGLLSAGVRVAASTDAPFGIPDPWAAMRAAVERRTGQGHVLGPDERVSAQEALQLFLGPLKEPGIRSRRIEVGAPADLCLLQNSLAGALVDLHSRVVRATVIRGRLVYEVPRSDLRNGC